MYVYNWINLCLFLALRALIAIRNILCLDVLLLCSTQAKSMYVNNFSCLYMFSKCFRVYKCLSMFSKVNLCSVPKCLFMSYVWKFMRFIPEMSIYVFNAFFVHLRSSWRGVMWPVWFSTHTIVNGSLTMCLLVDVWVDSCVTCPCPPRVSAVTYIRFAHLPNIVISCVV